MKPDAYLDIRDNKAKIICRFTDNGFFYNDQKIEDNGEIYRLLKQVLNGVLENQIEDIKLKERERCAKIAEEFYLKDPDDNLSQEGRHEKRLYTKYSEGSVFY